MTARFEDASNIQKSLQDWLSDKQRGGTLIKELQNKLNEAVTHLKLTDDEQRPYHKKILQMKDRFNSHTTDTSRSNLTTSSRDVDPITRFAFGTVLLVGSPIYRMCNGFFGKSKEFTRDARNIKAEVDLLRYERSFFKNQNIVGPNTSIKSKKLMLKETIDSEIKKIIQFRDNWSFWDKK